MQDYKFVDVVATICNVTKLMKKTGTVRLTQFRPWLTLTGPKPSYNKKTSTG